MWKSVLKSFASRLTGPLSNLRKRRIRQRVIRRKQLDAGLPPYESAPTWSIAVQFFNKRQVIDELYMRVGSIPSSELIVLDDGSEDGSHSRWMSLMKRKNDFLLRSNDLHEVRTYDRAISFCRGEYVALLQDDDLPPADGSWLRDARSIFEEFPRLAILGGRNGVDLLDANPGPGSEPFGAYDGYRVGGFPGLHGYKVFSRPFHASSLSGIRMTFVDSVNRAPMIIRREAALELGGVDQRYAPFQCDDADICIRAWKNDWAVAFYESGFQHFVAEGGMREFNRAETTRQADRNWKLLYEMHQDYFLSDEHRERVAAMNRTLVTLPAGS